LGTDALSGKEELELESFTCDLLRRFHLFSVDPVWIGPFINLLRGVFYRDFFFYSLVLVLIDVFLLCSGY